MATQAAIATEGFRRIQGPITVPIVIAAASGNQTIKTAASLTTTSGRWAVIAYHLVSDTDTVLIWRSATGTELSGSMTIAARVPICLEVNNAYLYICNANENLTLNVSLASTIGGSITLVELV